jgi:hypothetical protein
LVVAGGHGAVSLEPVDAALDGVTLLVRLPVERGWSTAGQAAARPVVDLVRGLPRWSL